jgi:hypothetical protein
MIRREMMKRVTLYDRVENYLKENGSITSWEAIKEFGATRLSAIIYVLRNEREMNIDTIYETGKNRYGDKITYAKYTLKEDN